MTVGEKLRKPCLEHQSTVVFYHDNFENYTGKIHQVVCFLRANFLTPKEWSTTKVINAVVTFFMLCLASYSLCYILKLTFEDRHTPYEMASQLIVIAWAVQAIVSILFLVYWQLYGHLNSYTRHVMGCQQGAGLAHGKDIIKSNIRWFYAIMWLEAVVIIFFEAKYWVETQHSEFNEKRSKMFYFPYLRSINSFITFYTYLIWHVTMSLYITYTNTAFVEVRYFNEQLIEIDGTDCNIEEELIHRIDTYSKLAGVIRELDRTFRLYAFIMLVIIIPSVIFTLMMMNQRIRSVQDLILCAPSIGLCAYSFLGVTVAPARLHDEVNRSKSCLLQNKSIWFPYRRDVYQIANTLCQHMEQYDLGISIWGFAIVSRPLILATFSVMTMVLSLIIELSPHDHVDNHHYPNYTDFTQENATTLGIIETVTAAISGN